MNIAVLASTRGTDLQAIMDEVAAGRLEVKIAVVITDRKDCLARKRAEDAGIKTVFIDPKDKSRAEFDEELVRVLRENAVDLVVLVGYMRMIGAKTLQAYPNKIINVHPALIPAFSGKDFYDLNVHQAVIERGVKVSGITIHFLNEECDEGPIIFQEAVSVTDDETPESLKEKIQNLEKKRYPEVIGWIQQGMVSVKGNKVSVIARSAATKQSRGKMA